MNQICVLLKKIFMQQLIESWLGVRGDGRNSVITFFFYKIIISYAP